jgi:hypothetical protein
MNFSFISKIIMPPRKLRKNYNDANVEQAVKAVKEEGMSLRQASEAFNVPKSTILENTKKDQLTAIGKPTVLTAREETLIFESCPAFGNLGVSPAWR